MRIRAIIGIALIAVGFFILVRGLSFKTQREVLEFGGLKASLEEKRAVPPWVGGVAILGGALLVTIGRWRRGPA